MKTIYILFIIFNFLFILSSCSLPTRNWAWVVEDTKNIMNNYGNTLQWSVKDARAVRDMYNQDTADLQKEIQESIK